MWVKRGGRQKQSPPHKQSISISGFSAYVSNPHKMKPRVLDPLDFRNIAYRPVFFKGKMKKRPKSDSLGPDVLTEPGFTSYHSISRISPSKSGGEFFRRVY